MPWLHTPRSALRNFVRTGSALAAAAALSGCGVLPSITSPSPSQVGVNVNDQQSFFPDLTGDNDDRKPLSLKAMEHASAPENASPKEEAKELLFLPAMRQAAFAYGVAGGLAYSTNIINTVLRKDASDLSGTYDFTRIVTYEPGGAMILPPVISSSTDTYQEADFGRTIRVAGQTYDIIQEAQFAPNAPLWFAYLYRPWQPPHPPASSTLPHTDDEHRAWVQFVDEGWQDGEEQGLMNFKLDLAKLNQDFTGMIRYRELYDAGKVSAPVIRNQYLGTTGTGMTMRENDRVEKIIQEPRLYVPEGAASSITPAPGSDQ